MPTTIPPKTKQVFDRFVTLANKQAVHPYDWDRFRDFVRAAHRHHVRLTPTDLKTLLDHQGFDTGESQVLALVYEHGRLLLGSDPGYLHRQETLQARARRELDARRNARP